MARFVERRGRAPTRAPVIHLLLIVAVIAVVDSINPATVAPALYLSTSQKAVRSVGGFIAGVVLTNFLGGFVILIGPGQGLLAIVPRPGEQTRHLIEVGVGVALLLLAAVLWRGRHKVAKHVKPSRHGGDRSSFVLGASIMAVELPTAFPYFAAITAILGSGSTISRQVIVLAVYNAIFVAPLLLILGVRMGTGRSGRRQLERMRVYLDSHFASLIPILLLLAAVALIALGAIGLA